MKAPELFQVVAAEERTVPSTSLRTQLANDAFAPCRAPANLSGRKPSRLSPLPKWRLQRVQILVDARITDPLTLAEMASAAGLSRMHFAAQFRAATGLRPHEYLLTRRVLRAMALMLTEDTPLAQLALAVGFQSQSHFSTVFKRLTGTSPAAWRAGESTLVLFPPPSVPKP